VCHRAHRRASPPPTVVLSSPRCVAC
jgi:hypothetical protein